MGASLHAEGPQGEQDGGGRDWEMPDDVKKALLERLLGLWARL